MSVSGILSSAVFGIGAQIFQSRMQKVQKQFQQLGQDLQFGNLTAAKSDFATLLQLRPAASSGTPATTTNPIAHDFAQLAADLKAGNTKAAQQDYAKIQQDLQSQPTQTHRRTRHHSGSGSSDVSQLFTQSGQALQLGNLTAAQQAYATMQAQFQQYARMNPSPTQSGSTGVSVSA
jgi:hypothetical protein